MKISSQYYMMLVCSVISMLAIYRPSVCQAEDMWYDMWHMKISFTNYNRTETLSNFPALVIFSNNMAGSGFDFRKFRSANGYDLRFWNDLKTTNLNYEIDNWSTGSSSYVWVQIPKFTNNSYIWATWGGSLVQTNRPAYTTNGATWQQGYSCVWHFKAGAGNLGADSCSNFNNLVTENNSPSYSAGGKNGGALYLDGSSTMIKEGGAFSTGVPISNQAYTVTSWAKAETNCLLTGGWYGWGNLAPSQGNNMRLWGNYTSVWRCWNNDDVGGVLPSGSFTNDYHFVVDTWDGVKCKIYLDGVMVTSTPPPNGQPNVGTNIFRIGKTLYDVNFKGWVDDLMISSVVRSSNWIWACYMNQASNSSFVAPGSVKFYASGTVLGIR